MNRSTDELMKILKKSRSIESYLSENSKELTTNALQRHMEKLLIEKKMTIAKAARRGQMSESYLYKINQGVKTNISRDKVIQICFGFGLDCNESETLMRAANANPLYPRIRRDSIILFCLENGKSVIECDRMLDEAGEDTILKE